MMRQRTVFTGRVQGVGFRYTTHTLAARRPLTGFVRNQEDGSVLLEVQGPEDEVHAFIADLRTTMSRYIKAADSSPLRPVENEPSFEIRR